MYHRLLDLPRDRSFFLFGPRQTGKSTLIEAQFGDAAWHVNLLEEDVFLLYSRDPALFRRHVLDQLSRGTKTVFVDEVQRLPALLNEVHSVLLKHKVVFILTGSSARKLKRGGANLLAGRAVRRDLFPFICDEISDVFDLDVALIYGTLPPIVLASDTRIKRDILSAYVTVYLREEIQMEGLSRNIGAFSRFLDMAAFQFGETLNFANISRECQIAERTVQGYYEILEDTLIGFYLHPWRKSLRKRLSSHPKFYFFDNGVTNAITKRLTDTFDPIAIGRLFEQWVIQETVRRISYAQSEASVFYWKTNNGAEVDLLIEKHGKLLAAVEIKSSKYISGAHLSGIRSFRAEHPTVPCFVVSRVPHSYELDGTQILVWKEFFDKLREIL